MIVSGCSARKGLVLFLYCFLTGLAGAQGLDALYVQQSSGAIMNINTSTGASTTLATFAGKYWNGAAYDQQNGLLYIDALPTNGYSANTPITNTIYSFNPSNPGAGVTLVGTITGQSAFTGAAFYNGDYYAIGSGSNQLVAYNLAAVGGPALVSTQTLGGLGSGITGVSLGDLDLVGNTLWISAGTVTSTNSGAGISGTYMLYQYTTISNTTTPALAVSEGTTNVGVGIAWDFNTNKLIMFNVNAGTGTNGSISLVDQSSGAQTLLSTLTGPAAAGGAGDFAIVPEPRTYAFWSIGVVFALVFAHRLWRRRAIAVHPPGG